MNKLSDGVRSAPCKINSSTPHPTPLCHPSPYLSHPTVRMVPLTESHTLLSVGRLFPGRARVHHLYSNIFLIHYAYCLIAGGDPGRPSVGATTEGKLLLIGPIFPKCDWIYLARSEVDCGNVVTHNFITWGKVARRASDTDRAGDTARG